MEGQAGPGLTGHEGDATLARGPGVSLERVGEDAVLYDRDNRRAHVLNESGARLWELLDGGTTLDRATRDFAAAYGLEPPAVAADVRALVETFRRLGVLR